jgi:predicted phage gp36 major capsid-like protein
MGDELLTEVLEVEREVRQRVDALEAETAERLAALERELESLLDHESDLLEKELARSLDAAELSARREAAAIREEAIAYGGRLGSLGDDELNLIVARYLKRIRPEIVHDRQDEQA